MEFMDYLIVTGVMLWAVLSVCYIVRAKRRGQSICCGKSCSACGDCAHCGHPCDDSRRRNGKFTDKKL